MQFQKKQREGHKESSFCMRDVNVKWGYSPKSIDIWYAN
jgi:hypothetical protein